MNGTRISASTKSSASNRAGFIGGGALAYRLGAGFVPIRKPGKLPAEKIRQEYQLEYGTDAVELHRDAIAPGERVLLVDDLLATGGTIEAACQLVEELGATDRRLHIPHRTFFSAAAQTSCSV